MLSGYPDTAKSWDRLAPQFESTHHVVKLAMPAYELPTLPAGKRWGYSLPEIANSLAKDVIDPFVKKGCKIHLVGHDWGAVIVLIYATQGKPLDKLVVLDVGIIKEIGLVNLAFQLLYQMYLALIFLFSRLLPNQEWATILLAIFPWKLVGPCPYETEVPFEPTEVKVHMTYPYWQMFLLPFSGQQLIAYKAGIPQLFIYGGRKRCMFHSQSYLDQLNSSPHSKAVQVDDSGHWVHWTNVDVVAHEMKLFLLR